MNYKGFSDYIISFLLREESDPQPSLSPLVGYTRDPEEMKQYKVVIYPSSFFDVGTYATEAAFPPLSPPLWKGTPLLFGLPQTEKITEDGPLILYADIVASTYFLISRYEEMIRRDDRDDYNRFPGKSSYPYQAGFIHRPIIEEYGRNLMELLEQEGCIVSYPQQGFSQINLTHDIDRPYEYNGIRSFFRAWIKEKIALPKALKLAFQNVLKDRFWSFPRFLEWNREVARKYPTKCSTILFYKTPGKWKEDRPNYRANKYPISRIHELALKFGAEEGWHVPLSLSQNPNRRTKSLQLLEQDLKQNISKARYHYLAAGEPEDTSLLISLGIREDYSMGYADVAGFRLGTCRPVRFISPNRGELTSLTLHPLTLMEATLTRPNYMNLGEKEAFCYAESLLEEVAKHRGELTLLFHNDSLAKEVSPLYSKLYRELLRTIFRLEPSHEDPIREHTSEGHKPWHPIE